jgi:hypothetical protein
VLEAFTVYKMSPLAGRPDGWVSARAEYAVDPDDPGAGEAMDPRDGYLLDEGWMVPLPGWQWDVPDGLLGLTSAACRGAPARSRPSRIYARRRSASPTDGSSCQRTSIASSSKPPPSWEPRMARHRDASSHDRGRLMKDTMRSGLG